MPLGLENAIYINKSSVQILHIMPLEYTKCLIEDFSAHSHETSRAEHNCGFWVSHGSRWVLRSQLIKFEEKIFRGQGDRYTQAFINVGGIPVHPPRWGNARPPEQSAATIT